MSCSKISFNLLFAKCRRHPSGMQTLKGTRERENDSVFLAPTGFPVFTLDGFNASKIFLLTSANLTAPSFLVFWIFGMA